MDAYAADTCGNICVHTPRLMSSPLAYDIHSYWPHQRMCVRPAAARVSSPVTESTQPVTYAAAAPFATCAATDACVLTCGQLLPALAVDMYA